MHVERVLFVFVVKFRLFDFRKVISCRETCQHLVSKDHPVHIDSVSDWFVVSEVCQQTILKLCAEHASVVKYGSMQWLTASSYYCLAKTNCVLSSGIGTRTVHAPGSLQAGLGQENWLIQMAWWKNSKGQVMLSYSKATARVQNLKC